MASLLRWNEQRKRRLADFRRRPSRPRQPLFASMCCKMMHKIPGAPHGREARPQTERQSSTH